jgi:SAM-dependent methyltransferase
MEKLNDDYWSERYAANQTGWDLSAVSPPLKEYIDQLQDKSLRILIPGCGNAYEAEYLLSKNFDNINLIDISEVLVNNIKSKYSEYIENSKLNVLHDDFFKHNGEYDLILEQTFFCALNPSLRKDHAKKMSELLAPNGRLVGVMFNREFIGGPPFGGSSIEYRTYFEPYFEFDTFEPCYNSIPPRQGVELFINLRKV